MDNKDTQHLAKLQAYWDKHQAFASMAKLRAVVGMTSTASVFEMVGRLVDAGYLQRIEGRIAPTQLFFARPVRTEGPTSEQKSSPIDIRSYVKFKPSETFFVKVTGGRLTKDFILDGDLLVMQKGLKAQVNDFVLLERDGSCRLERFGGFIGQVVTAKLVSADKPSSAVPQTAPLSSVAGVAVGLIRRFDRQSTQEGRKAPKQGAAMRKPTLNP
jgi:repressor LexA